MLIFKVSDVVYEVEIGSVKVEKSNIATISDDVLTRFTFSTWLTGNSFTTQETHGDDSGNGSFPGTGFPME